MYFSSITVSLECYPMPEFTYKKFIPLAVGAVAIAGVGGILASKSSNVSVASALRFEETNLGVIGDSMNGEMFGWSDTRWAALCQI